MGWIQLGGHRIRCQRPVAEGARQRAVASAAGSTGRCRSGSRTTRGRLPSCTSTATCIRRPRRSSSCSPRGCSPGYHHAVRRVLQLPELASSHEFKAFKEFVDSRKVRYSIWPMRVSRYGGALDRRAVRPDGRPPLRLPRSPDHAGRRDRRSRMLDPAPATDVLDLTVFVSCYNEADFISTRWRTFEPRCGKAGLASSRSSSSTIVEATDPRIWSRLTSSPIRKTASCFGATAQPRARPELYRRRVHRDGQVLPADLRRQCRAASKPCSRSSGHGEADMLIRLLCQRRGKERLSPVRVRRLHGAHQFRQRPPTALLQWPGGASALQHHALAPEYAWLRLPGRHHLHAARPGCTYMEIAVQTIEPRAATRGP